MTPLDQLVSDCEALASDRPQVTAEKHGPNDFYGHAAMLKAYAGWPAHRPLPLYIQHGVRFDLGCWARDALPEHRMGFVPSQWRVDALSGRVEQRLVPVGPYLHYSPPLWDPAETEAAARGAGRLLLAYPAHSTHWINTDYDVGVFCAQINALRPRFDSVLVCLYWKDILRGVHRRYGAEGFRCVTAGHIYDPKFMPRQRSILEAGAAVLTNQLGSHVGYAIHLGKPVQLLHAEVVQTAEKTRMLEQSTAKTRLDVDRFRAAFAPPPEGITSAQLELIEKYWGLSAVKNPMEIRSVLEVAERRRRVYVLTLGLPWRVARRWRAVVRRVGCGANPADPLQARA